MARDNRIGSDPGRAGARFTTLRRHLLVIAVGSGLVYLFGQLHGQWIDMHRWNRATADASFLLLSFTMAIGPLARIVPMVRRLVPLRRELGIYTVVLALIHTVIIFDGWLEWNLFRLVGMALQEQTGRYVMVQHGFALANILGLAALLYGVVLALTSSDRAVRLLGASVWKFVQSATYVLWALAVVHTAYFLFIHYVDYHRQTPEPNPTQPWFAGLVVAVLLLRLTASIITWRHKRNAPRGAALAEGT